jgi:hypothetical protein
MSILREKSSGKIFIPRVYKPRHEGAKDLFVTFSEIPVVEGSPGFEWKGGKFPLALWRQVTSFFEHTQLLYKCESQVRLYYNEKTLEWAAWAYPQKLRQGLYTKEIDEGGTPELIALKDAQRGQFRSSQGWMEFGTIHHHCTSSAFQSGTDSGDEKNRTGLHITVGNIGSKKYDLHFRVTYKEGDTYSFYTGKEIDIAEWFETPAGIMAIPAKYRRKINIADAVEDELKVVDASVPFPEEWKKNLIEPEQNVGFAYRGYQGGGMMDDEDDHRSFYNGGYGGSQGFRQDQNLAIAYIMKSMEKDCGVTPEQFCLAYDALLSIHRVTGDDICHSVKRIFKNDIADAMAQPAPTPVEVLKLAPLHPERQGSAGERKP